MPQSKLNTTTRGMIWQCLVELRAFKALANRLGISHQAVSDMFRPDGYQTSRTNIEPTAESIMAALALFIELRRWDIVEDVMRVYGAPAFRIEPVKAADRECGAVDVAPAWMDTAISRGELADTYARALEDGRITEDEAREIHHMTAEHIGNLRRVTSIADKASER